MKEKLFLYVCFICILGVMPLVYADEDCELSFEEARQAYDSGDYAKAKALFEYVVDECGAAYNNAAEWVEKSSLHPGEPEMVLVKGGTFRMGCTAEQGGDCYYDESPNHLVTVFDFYIGKYEVTQAQWEAVMGTSISQQRDKAGRSWSLCGVGANYPMYYVSWNEVQEFISRLNALTGKQYRLPTEAEWEYAARGGNQSRGYKYSGSNFIEQVAWFTDNSGGTTHPVGTKSPNELGIYDMSGNVWEWCYDWYGSYSGTQQTNPMGPSSGSTRVNRGGGGGNFASYCRVSYRGNGTPTARYDGLGFRLVLSH